MVRFSQHATAPVLTYISAQWLTTSRRGVTPTAGPGLAWSAPQTLGADPGDARVVFGHRLNPDTHIGNRCACGLDQGLRDFFNHRCSSARPSIMTMWANGIERRLRRNAATGCPAPAPAGQHGHRPWPPPPRSRHPTWSWCRRALIGWHAPREGTMALGPALIMIHAAWPSSGGHVPAPRPP